LGSPRRGGPEFICHLLGVRPLQAFVRKQRRTHTGGVTRVDLRKGVLEPFQEHYGANRNAQRPEKLFRVRPERQRGAGVPQRAGDPLDGLRALVTDNSVYSVGAPILSDEITFVSEVLPLITKRKDRTGEDDGASGSPSASRRKHLGGWVMFFFGLGSSGQGSEASNRMSSFMSDTDDCHRQGLLSLHDFRGIS